MRRNSIEYETWLLFLLFQWHTPLTVKLSLIKSSGLTHTHTNIRSHMNLYSYRRHNWCVFVSNVEFLGTTRWLANFDQPLPDFMAHSSFPSNPNNDLSRPYEFHRAYRYFRLWWCLWLSLALFVSAEWWLQIERRSCVRVWFGIPFAVEKHLCMSEPDASVSPIWVEIG